MAGRTAARDLAGQGAALGLVGRQRGALRLAGQRSALGLVRRQRGALRMAGQRSALRLAGRLRRAGGQRAGGPARELSGPGARGRAVRGLGRLGARVRAGGSGRPLRRPLRRLRDRGGLVAGEALLRSARGVGGVLRLRPGGGGVSGEGPSALRRLRSGRVVVGGAEKVLAVTGLRTVGTVLRRVRMGTDGSLRRRWGWDVTKARARGVSAGVPG
ncbi:hypothetical protein SAMN05421803_12077 [Nocardiopsis flavescens]|uniref:Uncharacterized protein n=1 Tax=Nocardiopsis flavescens TaxID=758803 RepID=A0A1M6SLQ4_9ACTN|nr:hypothetical protein SAMN05421803_12077 [Nocardiopsis flavescens]